MSAKLVIVGAFQLLSWTRFTLGLTFDNTYSVQSGHPLDQAVIHYWDKATTASSRQHQPLTYAEKYQRYYKGNGIFSDVQLPWPFNKEVVPARRQHSKVSRAKSQYVNRPAHIKKTSSVPQEDQPLTYAEKYLRYYNGNGIFSNVKLPWPFNSIMVPSRRQQDKVSNEKSQSSNYHTQIKLVRAIKKVFWSLKRNLGKTLNFTCGN